MTESQRKVTNKKVVKVMNKVEKNVDRGFRFATFSIVLIVMMVGMWSAYCAWYWHAHNRIVWQSPIKIELYTPIYVEDRAIRHVSVKDTIKSPVPLVTPKTSPTKAPKKQAMTERDIVMSSPHGKILWNIYMLETTRGVNDYCRLTGRGFGGFGVMDDTHSIVCYDTFSKAVERADYWLTQLKVDQRPLVEVLCLWNRGIQEDSCSYYDDYITLK